MNNNRKKNRIIKILITWDSGLLCGVFALLMLALYLMVGAQTPDYNHHKYLPASDEESQDELIYVVNGVRFKMIRIRGYESLIDYYIGETEVTQELWEAVMGSNPSYFKGANRPVESVSWNDCMKFIHKLNAITGKVFHLPSTEEWDRACGKPEDAGLDDGWFAENSGDILCDSPSSEVDDLLLKTCRTHDVKMKKADEHGLYDMFGNVGEFCYDEGSSTKIVVLGSNWGTKLSDKRLYGFGRDEDNGPSASNKVGLRLLHRELPPLNEDEGK